MATVRGVDRGRIARVAVPLCAVLLCAGLLAARCSAEREPRARVTESDARHALTEMAEIASARTRSAMQRLCALSRDDCVGISGSVVRAPETAPVAASPPQVLCSRDVGDGAWMLVVEGDDGVGRHYVSQVVFARDDDGRTVPRREPAFWLGVAYLGTRVTGATGWSTAYGADDSTDPAHTERMLDLARRSCSAI